MSLKITINGKTFTSLSGKNISVINDVIIIDGKVITSVVDGKVITDNNKNIIFNKRNILILLTMLIIILIPIIFLIGK